MLTAFRVRFENASDRFKTWQPLLEHFSSAIEVVKANSGIQFRAVSKISIGDVPFNWHTGTHNVHPLLLTGFVRLIAFYVTSAILFARAEVRLSSAEKSVLRQMRRSFLAFPFLIVAGVSAVTYWRPSALWVFLLVSYLIFAFVANWHFRNGGLPPDYTSSYLRGSIV